MSAVLEVAHLVRRFGSFTAVNDVSFTVEKGEIFGYLGANGAGKSTTIRMLTGLLMPSSGRAIVAGYDVSRDPEGVKSSIGYMSQKFSLYLDLPVLENLRFFGGAYGLRGRELRERTQEALERSDLVQERNTTTGALPAGVRQRLALACSLQHRPSIVFLDEPTAGVDPSVRRTFWQLIRSLSQGGTTVFVTTHYLDEAEYCHRIGLMAGGRLVALDTPANLKKKYVPECVLVARGKGLGRAASVLGGRSGIKGVAPFGAGLHLRVDPAEWSHGRLLELLHGAGASEVTLEASEASLEDVFLAAVGESTNPTDPTNPTNPTNAGEGGA